ncbi:hypothetical protein C5167_010848 [Papaver somniferum]|uniref:Uncharacterized protein n=1 Tax=Papaver somniferum TaxID=3469 RepID=A0A4Y7K1E3_PAPSO|nr:hypothetical protein C5167_010848 [Papaver somniferum]
MELAESGAGLELSDSHVFIAAGYEQEDMEECNVIVSEKLREARAKSMKFKDGYMISSGQLIYEYIDSSVRHVLLRLSETVENPKGKNGPMTPLPDVTIHQPKVEEDFVRPSMMAPTEIEMAFYRKILSDGFAAVVAQMDDAAGTNSRLLNSLN